MNLQQRIELLSRLGQSIINEQENWEETILGAERENPWFIPAFTQHALHQVAYNYLNKEKLESFCRQYGIPNEQSHPQEVGLVLAGNIPLVGFHDILMVFLSGHRARVKPSSRDQLLIKRLLAFLTREEPRVADWIKLEERLNNCQAYIATGSGNTSRYFEYYFGKYPNIIRKNRSSVAILDGNETEEQLKALSRDIHLYFGLGCRNVTKIMVPENYDFIPLIQSLDEFKHLADHHKFKNNYDYNLVLLILNRKYYMTNGSTLLVEDPMVYSPISQLNYEYYNSRVNCLVELKKDPNIQCVVGNDMVPFGEAQHPGLSDFADGVDTMRFLLSLSR